MADNRTANELRKITELCQMISSLEAMNCKIKSEFLHFMYGPDMADPDGHIWG